MRDGMAVPGFGAAGVDDEASRIADRTGFGHQEMLGQCATGACSPHLGPGSDRWQGSLHGADDAPLEVELAALVVAREVVRDLNALHRGVDDLPPLRSVGVRMAIRFVDDNLQGCIRHADEGGFPALRGPFAV